jgi:hypothetical protein
MNRPDLIAISCLYAILALTLGAVFVALWRNRKKE